MLAIVLASATISVVAFFAERAARKESDQSRRDAESHAKVADEKSQEADRQAAEATRQAAEATRQAGIAQKERQRAESALYVSDIRVAAGEIRRPPT